VVVASTTSSSSSPFLRPDFITLVLVLDSLIPKHVSLKQHPKQTEQTKVMGIIMRSRSHFFLKRKYAAMPNFVIALKSNTYYLLLLITWHFKASAADAAVTEASEQ